MFKHKLIIPEIKTFKGPIFKIFINASLFLVRKNAVLPEQNRIFNKESKIDFLFFGIRNN